MKLILTTDALAVSVDCISAGSPATDVSSDGCVDLGRGFAQLADNSTFLTPPGAFTIFEFSEFVLCGAIFVNNDEVTFEYCYDDLVCFTFMEKKNFA